MEIYVDFLGDDDRYRARGASFVDPSLPLAALRAAASIEAAERAETLRLFHVESSSYLSDRRVADVGIRARDSVVVVSRADGAFPAPSDLRVRWSAAGGVARRLVLLG